ncbi:PAS domain S-box protein [Cyanobacterium stanieri LEGE 03274]|uniref:histidine kinase n=1 Tax=Cyanobacterium stanieri LEGE 03274 TaxID=1828756 RepID=A0ABR9V4H6_9CHRO|nr:PAS domain S-box protein [Cyanobacterium stanieri]MBE9222790.1 PAS domain S-box protein [Cyanobacterium stanieri LEGE 03274]
MTQPINITIQNLQSAMIDDPLTVSPQSTLTDVITLIHHKYHQQHDPILKVKTPCTCAVVVESDKIVGILTLKDILGLTLSHHNTLDNLVIGEVMKSPVITLKISEFDDLSTPKNLLKQHNINHLPIIDENNYLVGLVTHQTIENLAYYHLQKQLQEKQQTEENLKESENRFRQLAENIDLIFYLTNPECTETYYISPSYESIWGKSCQSLYENPTSYLDNIHPEDKHIVLQVKENQIYEEQTTAEYRIIRPDGEIRWILDRTFHVKTSDCQTTRICGIAEDITAGKEYEIQLIESTRELETTSHRLQEVQRIAKLAHWEYDHRNHQVYWSEQCFSIFELNPDQFIPTYNNFLQFVHPGDRPLVHQHYSNHIHNHTPYSISHRIITPKGEIKYIQNQCETEYTLEGKPIISRGTTQDITAIKQTEIELAKLNQQLEQKVIQRTHELWEINHLQTTILDSTDYAIISIDCNGYIKTFNRGAEKMLGYISTEVIDKTTPLLFLDKEEIKAHSLKIFQQLGQPIPPQINDFTINQVLNQLSQEVTIHHIKKNGTRFPVMMTINPLKNEQGETIGFLSIGKDITARKQTEIKIQKENILRQQILEKMGDGLCVFYETAHHPLIRFTIWNPKMETITGYSREEINTRGWFECVHPHAETRAIAIERLKKVSEGKNLMAEEWEIHTKNGEKRIITVSTSILATEGNIIFVLAVIQDITERKKKEIENLYLKERLEFALSSSPATIYSCDATQENLPVKFISPNVKTLVNYQAKDFISGSLYWNDFIHPDDIPTVNKTLEQELLTNNYCSLEYRFLTGNGDYIWLQDEMVLYRDNQGNPRNIVGYVANINDRKQAQIQLKQKTELLSTISKAESQFITAENRLTIFEQLLSDLLELTDSEYGFIGEVLFKEDGSASIEENFFKIKGVPYIKNRSITNIAWNEETLKYYEENFEEGMEFHNMQTLFGAVVTTGKPVIANNPSTDSRRGGTPQGHPPLNAFLGLPFFSGHNLVGIVGIANAPRDYDDAVIEYLQPFLMTCSILIEGFRLDQQKKLAEQQLFESNQQLIRANRLKDEFLANMSHELRTPLNAILGMTEGLLDEIFGQINNKQLKALNTIERSGTHLLELINDILDLAKIEAEHLELHCEPVSINNLCDSSLAFVKQMALKKRIQLTTDLPATFPDLIVDERRIRQVLINLLNNAVKFTPKGGNISLRFSCNPPPIVPDFFTHTFENRGDTSHNLSSQSYIYISVIDTGIGISPDNIQKLFQPFMQIDSALNRQYAGTGLGLSLVRKIVELHGGYVIVSSQLGVGSYFTIVLPCVCCDSSLITEAVDNSSIIPQNVTSSPLEKPLILLAEDNEANIRTIANYLKAKGYNLIFAENGEKAVSLAISEQPDLILMDIQMPQMNGLEAIALIREHDTLCNTPIIALTALAMKGDEEKCLRMGANEYLSKPLKMKQLVSKIQQLLMV